METNFNPPGWKTVCDQQIEWNQQSRTEWLNQTPGPLDSFVGYMNAPVRRVHVLTWNLANLVESNCPAIRLRPAYRDSKTKAFRRLLAGIVRDMRQVRRVYIPRYDVSKAQYC